ncbi:hypothetical protein IEQ34_026667 [Dendrobium chrysotoxum]|uniref:Uncharacterized protein n=1 Tax=Dendrobium chrysotoxum TaxID=161865 RepID=A0AAV7FL61_DENCH|nr:hypothetical protein IEQ34_026667 [Dendrobium chrysotoxum]
MTSTFVESLVVGRVIGEVVDLFVPTVTMSVNYGPKHINNGCDVKPSMAVNPPALCISGNISDLYTLIMTDPDAPSPSEPRMRECIHWLVVNIPGGTDPFKGEEIVPYMPPQPPLGIHRYVFVLFQQQKRIEGMSPFASRANFNTRLFASQLELGLPVAAVYFNCQRQPNNRRR